MIFLRKWMIVGLLLTAFLTACAPSFAAKESASEKLSAVMSAFDLAQGTVYSTDADAVYLFTDAMAERMFFFGRDISALSHAESTAVYVSRRFSGEEIVVMKLCDPSCRDEVERLFLLRAQKKKNAIVFHDGVYVYLICTDKNEDIRRFLIQ